jgi:hypothetical protein
MASNSPLRDDARTLPDERGHFGGLFVGFLPQLVSVWKKSATAAGFSALNGRLRSQRIDLDVEAFWQDMCSTQQCRLGR